MRVLLARGVQRSHRLRSTPICGDLVQNAAWSWPEDDDTVPAPRATTPDNDICDISCWSAGNADRFQFRVREKSDAATIRRPEGLGGGVCSSQRLGLH